MIDFLYEMRDFWIWYASLLGLTALLWAIPPTRRMSGIMMTGWKTMPAGCSLVLLVPVLGILLMGLILAGMTVLLYSWIFLIVCDLRIIPPARIEFDYVSVHLFRRC